MRYALMDPLWEKFKLTEQHNKNSGTMVETKLREKKRKIKLK